MKKLLPLFLLAFAALPAAAQKVKVDVENDTIYVNSQVYAALVKTGGSPSWDYSLKSTSGKELAYFKMLYFNSSREVSPSNPDGRVTYYEITFFNDARKCEIRMYASKKKLAEILVDNALIKDNAIDPEAENRFILINGANFSAQRDREAGNVIIINGR